VTEHRAKTVLIIDDTMANIMVAVEHLRAYSYELLTARDGETGLKRAELAIPDLILLDVEMPGLDGYETCRRLKANPVTAQIPVIFMTARTSVQDKVRGFEVGGVDFVTKPFEAQEMLARVQTHVELRALRIRLADEKAALEDRVRERTEQLRLQLERAEEHRREREQLLELVRTQSDQLRGFTRDWLSSRDQRDGDLSRTLRDRVGERLTRAHTHVDQARRLIQSGAESVPSTSDVLKHLDDAHELLLPAVAEAEEVSERLDQRDDQRENPLLQLSTRELEVLQLMVRGNANKEIAFALGIARTTVSTYRMRIMEKLGVSDLPALVRIAAHFRLGD